ncbi:MAG: YciI family protein [Noviherbaspirillum sp.]
MPYIVRCYYRPGAAEERFAIRASHIEYIISKTAEIVLAGGVCDDHGMPIGLFFALNVATCAAAQALIESEPYFSKGLFDRVEMEKLLQFVPHQNPNFLHEELARELARSSP